MAKKLKEEDLQLNLIVNGDKGRKEIGKLERTIKDTTIKLKGLEAQEKKLRKSGKENSAQYKKVKASMDAYNETITKSKARIEQLRSSIDITKLSYTELRQEVNRLTRLRNLSGPNSDNWRKYDARLQQVRSQFEKVRKQGQMTSISMKGLANSFNHYIGVITAGLATLSAAIFGVRKAIDSYAEFDDKIADVQKTTGLFKDDVLEINDELKNVDTRTAQIGLLGLGRVAGKLGKNSKQDVLDFIAATDQISVALTEDLGGDIEQSINDVGKLTDIFNVDEEFGIEQGLLKVGSTINELGANSTANEGYIVNFTKRLAGVAPAAKISLANVMGLGATLDMLGQTAEVSGTAFVNLIPNMFKETADFARIAGMGLEEFTDLLENDANEALIAVLKGVKGNESSMTDLVKRLQEVGVDGARATAVVSVMANNVDALRQQQALANKAFKEGTSLTDEFNIKNETAAAKLEKARKGLYNMTVQLGEELMPVMTFSTNSFSYFVKILSVLIDFLKRNATALITLTALLVTYNGLVFLSTVSLKENIVVTTAKILLDKGQKAGLILLAAAQALFTGNLTRATAAMRLFNAVTKLNPIVLLISILAAAGAAFIAYSRKLSIAERAQKSLNEVQKTARESVVDEKLKVEQLLDIAQDQTKSIDSRKKAIKALNDLSPEYLGNLDLEKIGTDAAKKATDKYIESLLKKAKVEAAQQKLVELNKKKLDLENTDNTELSFWQQAGVYAKSAAQSYSAPGTFMMNLNANEAIKKSQVNSEEIEAIKAQEKSLMQFLKANSDEYIELVNNTPPPLGDKPLSDEEKKAAEERRKSIEDYRQKVLESTRSAAEVENAAYELRLKQAGIFNKKFENMTLEDFQIEYALLKEHESNLAKIDADAISAEIARYEESFESQLNALKTKNNEELKAFQGNKEEREQLIKDQTAAEEKLVQENLEKLQSLIEITLDKGSWEGITSDDILSDEEYELLKKKLEEIGLSLSEIGLGGKSAKEDTESDTGLKYGLGGKTDILGFSPEDWELFFENLQSGKLGIDELIFSVNALSTAWQLHNEYVSKAERQKLENYEASIEQRKRSLDSEMQKELNNAWNSSKKRSDIEKKYAKKKEQLDAELDRKKAEFDYNEAKREKGTALMSAIVNVASQVAANLANPILAAFIGAMGAVQIGTIASTPLPELPGREDGGYLSVRRAQDRKMFRARMRPDQRGYVDRPTIIAGESGREFIASNEAYENPSIRPILDYIDTAQRNGTISTVRLGTILQDRPAKSISGRETGGYVSNQNLTQPSTDPEMKELLKQSLALNQKLSKQLEKPISAEVALLGQNGFIEKQAEYDQLTQESDI